MGSDLTTIKTQEACWEYIKIFPRLGEPYASPDLADLYTLQLSLLYPAGRSPVWLWIKWCLCYGFFLPRLENCSLNQNKWGKNYSQKKEHFCKCLIGLITIILACSNLNTTTWYIQASEGATEQLYEFVISPRQKVRKWHLPHVVLTLIIPLSVIADQIVQELCYLP